MDTILTVDCTDFNRLTRIRGLFRLEIRSNPYSSAVPFLMLRKVN
jgi:hypothetical protein